MISLIVQTILFFGWFEVNPVFFPGSVFVFSGPNKFQMIHRYSQNSICLSVGTSLKFTPVWLHITAALIFSPLQPDRQPLRLLRRVKSG